MSDIIIKDLFNESIYCNTYKENTPFEDEVVLRFDLIADC
jgi:hypothetical protein